MARRIEDESDECSKLVRTNVRSRCCRWRTCAVDVQGRGEGREVRHGQRGPAGVESGRGEDDE